MIMAMYIYTITDNPVPFKLSQNRFIFYGTICDEKQNPDVYASFYKQCDISSKSSDQLWKTLRKKTVIGVKQTINTSVGTTCSNLIVKIIIVHGIRVKLISNREKNMSYTKS